MTLARARLAGPGAVAGGVRGCSTWRCFRPARTQPAVGARGCGGGCGRDRQLIGMAHAPERVPLVVPEVNGATAADRPLGIIANPNCATIQLVVALAALQRAEAVTARVVTTLQSVSGAGQKGVRAARGAGRPSGAVAGTPFVGQDRRQRDSVDRSAWGDGWNEEEQKIRAETRGSSVMPDLPMAATCVRVPVVSRARHLGVGGTRAATDRGAGAARRSPPGRA
jgi:hypothetical protein